VPCNLTPLYLLPLHNCQVMVDFALFDGSGALLMGR
jgi:hypothetical protein